jgi:hypothetical protein
MPEQDSKHILVALGEVGGKSAGRTLPKINACGDIGLKIARDGTWFYQGSPIGRKPLVKLFASVLRLEEDGSYWLVTPAEKVTIAVEDVPFLAVEMTPEGEGETQRLRFRTNLDEVVVAGGEHPLSFRAEADGSITPYVEVRPGLRARLTRPVYYELVGRSVQSGSAVPSGIWSGGVFFPFPPAGTR